MNDAPVVDDLYNERLRSLKKVKDAWQSIIEKYSVLKEDQQGDVVDLRTGAVIKDLGHLRSMRDSRTVKGDVWHSLFEVEQQETNRTNNDDLIESPTKKIKSGNKRSSSFGSPGESFSSIPILTDSEEDVYDGLFDPTNFFSQRPTTPRRTTRSAVAEKDNLTIEMPKQSHMKYNRGPPGSKNGGKPGQLLPSAKRLPTSSNIEDDPLKLSPPKYSKKEFSQLGSADRVLFKQLPEGLEGLMITPTKVRRFKEALIKTKANRKSGNNKLKRLLWTSQKVKSSQSINKGNDGFWIYDPTSSSGSGLLPIETPVFENQTEHSHSEDGLLQKQNNGQFVNISVTKDASEFYGRRFTNNRYIDEVDSKPQSPGTTNNYAFLNSTRNEGRLSDSLVDDKRQLNDSSDKEYGYMENGEDEGDEEDNDLQIVGEVKILQDSSDENEGVSSDEEDNQIDFSDDEDNIKNGSLIPSNEHGVLDLSNLHAEQNNNYINLLAVSDEGSPRDVEDNGSDFIDLEDSFYDSAEENEIPIDVSVIDTAYTPGETAEQVDDGNMGDNEGHIPIREDISEVTVDSLKEPEKPTISEQEETVRADEIDEEIDLDSFVV